MENIREIAASAANGDIRFLNGKLWIPIKKFEAHLYQELGFSQDEVLRTEASFVRPKAVSGRDCVGLLRSNFVADEANEYPACGRLVYREAVDHAVFWKQLCWEKPFVVRFATIGEAAAVLRGIQRNWAHYPFSCFRRSELIAAKLPYISKKEKPFPYTVPLSDIGVWSLLDEHTLLASAKTSSPFPLGCIHFIEDHENPPSRAYLKLWEALCLLDYYYRCATDRLLQSGDVIPYDWALPQNGSRCIDAGACPGGWSWVLNGIGAEVLAIDRSPLADSLMQEPHITFMQHDAFTLTPESLGMQDWVFSDVICYPPRLFDWVERWLASGLCNKFVCTIKMQGTPDFETIRRFAQLPNSKIVHLTANKHELTWLHAPFIGQEL